MAFILLYLYICERKNQLERLANQEFVYGARFLLAPISFWSSFYKSKIPVK